MLARLQEPRARARFLSVFGIIASFFPPDRHLMPMVNCRQIMHRRLMQWRELACLQPAICSELPFISDRLAHVSALAIPIGVNCQNPAGLPATTPDEGRAGMLASGSLR